ncbi:FadR/GntR family transcriptional regulator [Rhodococcoides yunnanense]|uniref:FCD domain-containing protein n=1 Tax=Rhodococcoides yunnanense TaxID=278209 RepID=A0ABU4BAF9_9NOCA|nr:FCD domain-containing protein [Rhodococcus yunnanensis]MDV6261169.1 FCD domain-containing protein [Rhodococcus yunnanensis]
MRQVQRSSLITQVTAQLRDEITSQRWPVGTRIPTEPELCEITGTGRNTVREAVQALVHAGMVERRQGSGTFVMTCSDLGGTLGKYFSDARHRDVTELRETLEVTAAALAADRRDEEDIRVMLGALKDRNMAWSDETPLADAVRIDAHLHRAIVAASHNAIYLEFYDSLLPVIHEAMRDHVLDHDDDYVAEHTALVDAVIDGDATRATDAARSLFHELSEPPARAAEFTARAAEFTE